MASGVGAGQPSERGHCGVAGSDLPRPRRLVDDVHELRRLALPVVAPRHDGRSRRRRRERGRRDTAADVDLDLLDGRQVDGASLTLAQGFDSDNAQEHTGLIEHRQLEGRRGLPVECAAPVRIGGDPAGAADHGDPGEPHRLALAVQ